MPFAELGSLTDRVRLREQVLARLDEPVIDHAHPRVHGLLVVVEGGALGAQEFKRGDGLAVPEQLGGVAVDRVAEPVIRAERRCAKALRQRVVTPAHVDGGIPSTSWPA